MCSLSSLWDSVEFVSKLNFAVQITGAICGILIVLIGFHLSALQDAKEKNRTITPSQEAAFINATRTTPKGKVHVIYNSPEAEVYEFAKRIWEVLDQAGFDLDIHLSQGIGGAPRRGIVLVINDRSKPPKHVEALKSALQNLGFDVLIEDEPDSHQDPESVEVFVGNKPN